jgi:two-component system sensor histidine kinase VicK
MSDTDNQKHNPPKANTPKRNSRLMAAADKQADMAKGEPSESRFHAVFNHSPLGNKIIDSELTIHQANPAALAMLGLTRLDELAGHKIIEFAHPDHVQEWQELQKELWERKTPYFILETRLVRQDGSAFWCQVTSVLFDDEAGELGYTSLQDITERKELEATNKRLYDAQETIMHLVAHDVRNPLAHIKIAVELLRHDEGHEAPKFLTIVEKAAEQAEAILKDVLYIGQLDAGQLPKPPTDLAAYLDAQLAAHRLAAQVKGVALELDVPPHRVAVNLNPNKFGRVVDNLLGNALKFTPAGGSVRVCLREHAGRPRLTVQDTGVGIPAEHQAHLFDKFSIAAREGLAGESTTGLGLFITQQIVRLHGGKIWVESTENKGSTFFIDL